MKRTFLGICLLLWTAACAHVDYVGKSYSPTSRVDLFFSEQEVTEPYEVMGKVVATGGEGVSAEKIQDQMMKKAQKKGADAVVILDLDRETSGQRTTYRETTKERKHGRTTTSGHSSTRATTRKEITALFLKYR